MREEDAARGTAQAAATAVASAPHEKGRSSGRAGALIAAGVALVVVLALGWIVAGLPGLQSPNVLGVALIIAALISGGLTLIFVVDALRKARRREQPNARGIVVVVICSLITGVIALIQLIQTVQQVAH